MNFSTKQANVSCGLLRPQPMYLLIEQTDAKVTLYRDKQVTLGKLDSIFVRFDSLLMLTARKRKSAANLE
jgi:hypothetical protein